MPVEESRTPFGRTVFFFLLRMRFVFSRFYFIMEALYSLGVILLKRLKHLEKY